MANRRRYSIWSGRLALALLPAAALVWAAPVQADDASAPEAAKRIEHHIGLDAAVGSAADDGALVLIVFTAEWCGPCKTLKHDTLDTDGFATKAAPLHVVYVDVDAHRDLAQRFDVNAIPALVLMTGLNQIVDRSTGVKPTDDVLKWIDDGRRRAANGQWIGWNNPDDVKVDVPTDDAGFAQVIAMLGDPSAARRAAAGVAMIETGDKAMPHLIKAAGDPYLGVRIGAADVLGKLAPQAPTFDPWATPDARHAQADAIAAWWKKVGSLPAAVGDASLDAAELRTVDRAMAELLGNDPIRRTEAMSTLIRFGPAALPQVRAAIKERATADDQKSIWVLEDVRWAILVSDGVEAKTHARRELARGSSQQRQEATERLGKAGRAALPALRELVSDADSLVRESAAAALTSVSGPDALEALAKLLDASDPNLRMIAAQSLGASTNAAAGAYLAKAVQDSDEVVATVAIAAMEEVKATHPDSVAALTRCLGDPRWRVRAAAAESLGKMGVSSAADSIAKLLSDDDPFVVRSALVALRTLHAAPDAGRLVELATRLPGLIPVAIDAMMTADTKATIDSVIRVYDAVDDGGKAAVLDALAQKNNYRNSDDSHWKPLLDKAAASENPSVRSRLGRVLAGRSVALAGQYAGDLLSSSDAATRNPAAAQVIRIAAWHWGVSQASASGDYGILAGRDPTAAGDGAFDGIDADTIRQIIRNNPDHAKELLESLGDRVPPSVLAELDPDHKPDPDADKNKPTPEQMRQTVRDRHGEWHKALAKRVEAGASTAEVIACYATGDGRDGLDALTELFTRPVNQATFDGIPAADACAVILKRLPWPQGQPLLTAAMKQPTLYALMLAAARHAPDDAQAYLLDADTIADRVVASVGTPAFEALARQLVGGSDGGAIDLGADTPATHKLIERLLASPNGAARALGVFGLGLHHRDDTPARLAESVADNDPWVRLAAVQGLLAQSAEPQALEKSLGSLLGDADPRVAALAAAGVLQPALRQVIGIGDRQPNFAYEGTSIWRYTSHGPSSIDQEAPPPSVIERKPEFLDTARRRLAAAANDKDQALRDRLSLVLAQYGEFDALGAEMDRWLAGPRTAVPPSLRIALALTGDERFLPAVARAVELTDSPYELRQTLGLLRGVRGDEARELRRTINERMRNLGF